MTTRELVDLLGKHPGALTATLIALPLSVPLLGLGHGREGGRRSPWRYIYSVLVYATSVPGLLAAVLTGYALLLSHESLLDMDLLVYGLPVLSMIATLALIRRNVSFDEIPGFDRLSGLFVLVGTTFLVLVAISRTRVWVVFGGSVMSLALLALAVFFVLKGAARVAFGAGKSPR